jgi:hypothetical protein
MVHLIKNSHQVFCSSSTISNLQPVPAAEKISQVLKSPPQLILVKGEGLVPLAHLSFNYSTHWVSIR